MRIAFCFSVFVLVSAWPSVSMSVETVHSIPADFRGSWYSSDVSQCELHTLEVSENGVVDFGGFEFTSGQLDGKTLTFTSDRCEEGECSGSPEEVTLLLENGHLRYSHLTDESGEPLRLTRCPS